jgi:hypothetical protein
MFKYGHAGPGELISPPAEGSTIGVSATAAETHLFIVATVLRITLDKLLVAANLVSS